MRSLNVALLDAFNQAFDPWGLSLHSLVIGSLSRAGQSDDVGAAVVGIRVQPDQACGAQIVNDPLHVLPIGAKIASEPGHGLRPLGSGDSSENLPPCTGEAEVSHQPVSGREQTVIEAEEIKHEIGDGLPGL